MGLTASLRFMSAQLCLSCDLSHVTLSLGRSVFTNPWPRVDFQ